MEIVYTKMQGAGNDFIVIDNRRYNFSSKQLAKLAAQVCQRKFSKTITDHHNTCTSRYDLLRKIELFPCNFKLKSMSAFYFYVCFQSGIASIQTKSPIP